MCANYGTQKLDQANGRKMGTPVQIGQGFWSVGSSSAYSNYISVSCIDASASLLAETMHNTKKPQYLALLRIIKHASTCH